MNIHKVIDQIQKLRSLTRSSNEHEAAAAAAAAAKLIGKHLISEEMLAEKDPSRLETPEEDGKFLYETERVIPWKMKLASFLAAYHGCSMWNNCSWSGGKSGKRKVTRLQMIGRPGDTEIVRYMFTWLSAEIERLSKDHAYGKGHVYVQSYNEGIVDGIKMQMNAAKVEIRRESTPEQQSAICKIDNKLVESDYAMSKLHPNLSYSKQTSQRRIDHSAHSSGVEKGKSIHLGKGLPGKPNSLLT
jgi:hypothetical protein